MVIILRVNVNGKQDSVGERLKNNDPSDKISSYGRQSTSTRNRDGIVSSSPEEGLKLFFARHGLFVSYLLRYYLLKS